MNNSTPRAQQVLALARKEAIRLNHEFVDNGHLLLGMIRLQQGNAFVVLSKMIVGGLEPLKNDVEQRMEPGAESSVDAPASYNTGVKRVLAQAGKQAKLLNHSYVGTEHILLGMLVDGGIARDALEHFGLTQETTRINVLRNLDPNIVPEEPMTLGTALPMVSQGPSTNLPATLREISSDAIRYWERCRIVYNLVLAAVVMVVFFLNLPVSLESLSGESVLGLFVLAVGANVLFCTAYLPDLFAQLSTYRIGWRQHRWILFAVGLTFAAIFTRWMAMAVFNSHHG